MQRTLAKELSMTAQPIVVFVDISLEEILADLFYGLD